MTRFLISVIIRIIKNKRSLKLRKIKYTILELIKKVKNNCKIFGTYLFFIQEKYRNPQ